MTGIGTLHEGTLHAALKGWYAQPGDRLEVLVGGYVIDIVRGDLMIEIQIGNFAKLKRKLTALITRHRVRLVHPIPQTRWIVRQATDGTRIGRRKSPHQGHFADVFAELVRIPDLILSPNFSLEVLLIHEEQIRCDDGQGSWRRRGWSIHDRRLIAVLSSRVWESPADFLACLPNELPDPFSNRELARALDRPEHRARQMTYCLRKMGLLEVVGKQGNTLLYSLHG